jgi:hypothetical protein
LRMAGLGGLFNVMPLCNTQDWTVVCRRRQLSSICRRGALKAA